MISIGRMVRKREKTAAPMELELEPRCFLSLYTMWMNLQK